jgi:hypothetical protein
VDLEEVLLRPERVPREVDREFQDLVENDLEEKDREEKDRLEKDRLEKPPDLRADAKSETTAIKTKTRIIDSTALNLIPSPYVTSSLRLPEPQQAPRWW